MQIELLNPRVLIYLKALRVNQWIKNFVIFTSVIFAGELFNLFFLLKTTVAFLIFCVLSSASYLLNDIIDYNYDKKHPIKKYRPIAAGQISIPQATFLIFLLSLFGLVSSVFFSIMFFLIALIFLLLHFFYSLYLKKLPVIDIFSISFSFMLRAFAGEVVTGFHIPIWLLLTIFFLSLFMASVKRHAELVIQGKDTRVSLYYYNEHFLDFLTYTSGTLAIISYSFYTYFEKIPQADTIFVRFFSTMYPNFEVRKWLMITIPLVVYGVARYAQLLYERYEGERPEKIITTDKPLLTTILLWGLIVVILIYIL